MREEIPIDLMMDTCVQSKKKRSEVLKRLKNNLHITNLEMFFNKKNTSFSIYMEKGKIYFDRSSFISILCSLFAVESKEDIDIMLEKINTSNITSIKKSLPTVIVQSIEEEIEEFKQAKEVLNSMVIKDEDNIEESQNVVYSSTTPNDLKTFMERELNKAKQDYDRVFHSIKKHNDSIKKLSEQIDTIYNSRIMGRLLRTYERLKNEMNITSITELTDAFVIDNLHFDKLLYVSLVLAHQKNHQDYIDENITKLTRGQISEFTTKITDKYHGKNKEFLKAMKAFELVYGKSAAQKENLFIEGADIHFFQYNFLSVENKKDIGNKIDQMTKTVIERYNQTQNDRYLVLIDKLQVLKELDVKELYIGQNSFEGYIGYKEENSNIMLDKYFEDTACTIPSINHACYIVDENDFELMATHSKEVVMQMIKQGFIRAKRIYHDRPQNKNKKYFKEKVLYAMRNPL